MLDKRSTALLIAVLIGVHLAVALLVALRAAYPTDIDERAHFSYVRHLAERGDVWPDFRDMRLVDGADPARWSDAATNLNHPPLYYWLMTSFVADLERQPLGAVMRMRLANVALSLATLALMLIAGMRLFAATESRFVFLAVIALNPRAATIAGMINNDNLAALAGALAFFGLVAAHRQRADGRNGVIIGAGLALAGYAKLTALVEVAAMVAIWQATTLLRRESVQSGKLAHVAVVAASLVLGVAPYLANLQRYGEVLYINRAHHEVPAALRTTMEVPEFILRMMTELAWSWPIHLPADAVQRWMLPALLGLAVIGLVSGRRATDAQRSGATWIGFAAMLAAALTFALNTVFLYRLHRETGFLSGAYFRYYLPLWPGIAAAIALAPCALDRRSWREAAGLGIFALLLYATVAPLLVTSFALR